MRLKQIRSKRPGWVLCLLLAAACNDGGGARNPLPEVVPAPRVDAASCADFTSEKQALFGDTHVHTAYSLDAWGLNTVQVMPEDAIRFARGEAIPHSVLGRHQLDRPLDFVVVTDHAEFFDLSGMCIVDPRNPNYDHPRCRRLREDPVSGQLDLIEAVVGLFDDAFVRGPAGRRGRAFTWRETQNAANKAQDPCQFSALIGYEWTGGSLSGTLLRGTVHRNVIFASDVVPDEAADARRFPHESLLWDFLQVECRAVDGCDVLAIPHSSFQSRQGSIWTLENREQARQRADFERLAEVYQLKGSSECVNANLDPQDPAYDPGCNFERNSLQNFPDGIIAVNVDERDDAVSNTVQYALAKGMAYLQREGFNPLELGLIGSTDTHSGFAGDTGEQDWVGSAFGLLFADSAADTPRVSQTFERSPGGLAAVWAEANTRDRVFAALERREAYGTSGTRIQLRFYAVPGDAAGLCDDPDFPAQVEAREGAVPMGAVYDRETHGPPSYLVWARADNTPLDRIEVVTVHPLEDPDGDTFQRRRTVLADTEGAGRARLCATWRPADPASGPTAVYARALELTTPRWSGVACARPGVTCADAIPRTVRERAWSSPIWQGRAP